MSTSTSTTSVVSRRRFIRVLAGTAVAGAALPLLAGCGQTAPSASSGNVAPGAATAAVGAAKPGSAYPTFMPSTGGPKPDFPAAGPQYQDGFSTYPKNPVKALPPTPPGLGSKVLYYTNNSAPAPPTPYDQNKAWQTVNKELNAEVSFTIIAQADYLAKLATVMAGNDLPDIMLIPGANASGAAQVQGLSQFLAAQCADLTPYLGGDAAKDYPNLAALPTYAWKNSGCARNGKLYMLPIERYYPGSMLLKNSAVYDQELGKDYVPKNADDFKRVLQQLTKPSQNQWGMGSYNNQSYYIYFYAAMFGAPNNWALDASGKLTKDIETPQYKEAIAYVRDLVVTGVYHPDALTSPTARSRATTSSARSTSWMSRPSATPGRTPGRVGQS
jgi:putative aldouronate transport system substrate-binding protein